MILSNEFLVDADLTRAWMLLSDLQTVVPCFPGASFISQEGEEVQVRIKVKIGAINSNFHGTIRFAEMDEAKHSAVIHGSGTDTGGKGKAVATICTTLRKVEAERTRVVIKADMAITGRIAQFGGAIIEEIASRLVTQFAVNLNNVVGAIAPRSGDNPSVTASRAASTAAVSPNDRLPSVGSEGTTGAAEEPRALNLGPVVGRVVLVYVIKYLVVPTGFFVLGWFARGLARSVC